MERHLKQENTCQSIGGEFESCALTLVFRPLKVNLVANLGIFWRLNKFDASFFAVF